MQQQQTLAVDNNIRKLSKSNKAKSWRLKMNNYEEFPKNQDS
jgi:hypothetical protein